MRIYPKPGMEQMDMERLKMMLKNGKRIIFERLNFFKLFLTKMGKRNN